MNLGGSTGTLATHLSTLLCIGELETQPKPLLLFKTGGDGANDLGFIA
jgi:hypothetical protein